MFLSSNTVPANYLIWFYPSWLLVGGELCVILFIVGDSVCFSLRSKTEAGRLVTVLVERPLKAKVSEDTISFGFKLIFCYCSVVSFFSLF